MRSLSDVSSSFSTVNVLPGQVARIAFTRFMSCSSAHFSDEAKVFRGGISAAKRSAVGPPAAADSIFLATHEPCCMCISSIVWSGFKRCYYLFPYETTRDQGIPHDLNIMYELWRVPRYRERNAFCTTAGILPLIAALEDGEARVELEATVARITQRYDELSTKYHAEKAANPLNTMAFN